MRITIDLDPDVDARLRQIARERGVALQTLIDETLRAGICGRERYALPTFPLGVRPHVNVEKARALATELEDEEFVRKLKRRN